MIQRTLFCVFSVITLVSCKNGTTTATVSSSQELFSSPSSMAMISSHKAPVVSSSAILNSSSVMLNSSSAMLNSSSAMLNSSSVMLNSSSVMLNSSSAMINSHSVVLSSSPILSSAMLSSSAMVKSSFASSVVSVTRATPSLSAVTAHPTVLTSSTVHVKSSSVIPSPVPVHSASPTVVPYPEIIVVYDEKNKVCLMAKLEVTFTVLYNKTGKNVPSEASVPLNGNNVSKGYCNETEAGFTLNWNEQGNSSNQHSFSMYFKNNKTSKYWMVNGLNATFNTQDSFAFPNATDQQTRITGTSNKQDIFGPAKDNQTYLCNSKDEIKMEQVTAIFSKIVLQPFSNRTSLGKEGVHCAADNSDDDDDDDNTVPIAVGAALGGLVLIVLVAYIIGRRRSNRGYEQV